MAERRVSADGRRQQGGGLGKDDKAARNQFRDANEHLGMEMPKPGRFFVLVGRALRLRCPYCGGGPVLQGWFKLRPACGNCGNALERGEQDYFLGGMLFNLILAELLFAGIFVAILVAMWPTVPWDAIEIGAPTGMVVTPILIYPFGKLVWLAFDLTFRPAARGGPSVSGRGRTE